VIVRTALSCVAGGEWPCPSDRPAAHSGLPLRDFAVAEWQTWVSCNPHAQCRLLERAEIQTAFPRERGKLRVDAIGIARAGPQGTRRSSTTVF
jgi:hypothetical protein